MEIVVDDVVGAIVPQVIELDQVMTRKITNTITHCWYNHAKVIKIDKGNIWSKVYT